MLGLYRHCCSVVLVALVALPLSAQESQPTESAAPPTIPDVLELPAPGEGTPTEVSPMLRASYALRELYLACRSGNVGAAADLIVYRGDDLTRRWQSTYDIAQPDEREAVEAVCQRLLAFNPEATPMPVAEYESDTESEGTWHVLSIVIADPDRSAAFAFLELGTGMALGDID